MGDFFTALWRFLVPPYDETVEKQYGWRVRVAITLLVTFLGTAFLGAVMAGVVPHAGFATVTEWASLKQEIVADRAERVSWELLQLRIANCSATTDAAKQEYYRRLLPLMTQYETLTGKNYTLPLCSDL